MSRSVDAPRARPTPWIRLAWMVGGLLVLALGVALFLEAHLGLPPWDVLIFGTADLLHVSPVLTRLGLIAVLLVLLVPLGGRPDPRVLLVPAMFGPMVSGWLAVVPTPGSLLLRVAGVAAGVVLCGLGLAGYVSGRVLVGPSDSVCELLATRGRRPLWQTRVGVDGAVLLLGLLAGGVVGVGTAVYALGSGPVMHATLARLAAAGLPGGPGGQEPVPVSP